VHDSRPSDSASRSWSGDSTVPGGERDEGFEPPSGTVVDRYVVLSTLGRGASGVVVAAFDPKLDRKVALKFLHRNVASDADHARLKGEAQALARLTHPNVIRVHDVGTFEGRVFMATELVEGSDLATWRAETKPGWREVVRVMIAAGQGLAAAHSAGLVHRDFKPRNILIGANGRPRVTDFGQARGVEDVSLSSSDSDTSSEISAADGVLGTTLTHGGALVGTPAYMSPEALGGAAPDPYTDQFGFCVSLHEMLWGERPFRGTTLASLAEAIRSGNIEPPPRRPRVPRSLRTAVRRGLAADPAARHASMTALLTALERAISWPRRVGWVVLPAAMASALAVAAWPTTPLAEDYCAQHDRRLERIWGDEPQERIEQAFAATELSYSATAWTRVHAHLDGVAAAWLSAQHEVCEADARGEAVDGRMLCLHRRYQELSSLVNALTHADAEVVEHALQAARALEIDVSCEDEVPPGMDTRDPVARREQEKANAALSQANTALEMGHRLEALADAEAAVAITEAAGLRWSEAEARMLRARALSDDGDPKPVEDAMDAAYAAAIAAGNDRVVAQSAMGLAGLLARHGEFEAADRWLDLAQSALDHREDDHGSLESQLANARGSVDFHRGQIDEALAHFRASLAIDEAKGRGEDPSLGGVQLNIGLCLSNLGRYDEALEALEDSLARTQYHYGESHPKAVRVLSSLCHVRGYAGQIDAALEACHEGIALIRENGDTPNPQLVHLHTNLGVVLFRAGRLRETEETYLQTLALGEEIFGSADPMVGNLLNNLGVLYVEMEQLDKAQEYYGRAVILFEGVFGSDHPTTGILRTNLAMAYANDGKLDEAETLVRQSIDILERTRGEESVELALSLAELARIHERRGELVQAVPLFERAMALRETAGGEAIELADTKYGLGLVVWELGERERGRTLLDQARELYRQAGGDWQKNVDEIDAWFSANATQ